MNKLPSPEELIVRAERATTAAAAVEKAHKLQKGSDEAVQAAQVAAQKATEAAQAAGVAAQAATEAAEKAAEAAQASTAAAQSATLAAHTASVARALAHTAVVMIDTPVAAPAVSASKLPLPAAATLDPVPAVVGGAPSVSSAVVGPRTPGLPLLTRHHLDQQAKGATGERTSST